MDAGQQDARFADLQRRFAELERRLPEVEADNQRLRAENQRLKAENARLRERLAQYELEIRQETSGRVEPSRPTDYGLEGEAKRRRQRKRRRKKKSPGRRPTQVKFNDAHRHEDVYPPDTPHDDCKLARQRAVWRLEDGRAVLVGYHIYAGPDGQEPRIPGVTPRCEYGIEILAAPGSWFTSLVSRWTRRARCSPSSASCRWPSRRLMPCCGSWPGTGRENSSCSAT
jgi:regulator of replication initiation timing